MTRQTYNELGWSVTRTIRKDGCVYDYQQTFTLSGAAQNLDLDIGFPFELNRIEYYSNDATAKSFTEDIYTGPTGFNRIVNLALDTNIPNAYAPAGSEGIYSASPVKIRTAVSASTAGKLLTKKVSVRRL